MKEPINFEKEAKLKAHRMKQKELISKIEENNKKILTEIREWESLNEKSVRLEKVYNLPDHIVKLMFQYNYNKKTLSQKILKYKDK